MMVKFVGQGVFLVPFGHVWFLVEIGSEGLIQGHFEYHVEVEQGLVEVQLWFGLEFLVHVQVNFVVLVFLGIRLLVQFQMELEF